ncbi:MAG: methylglyoxal synthase [Leptospiraceae bacterium]|nr:methylglyoxal synthase [Leptospiraceae bacterium]
MFERKRLALVAHDNCKADLIEWVEYNWQTVSRHALTTTGTTGGLIEKAIRRKGGDQALAGAPITKLKSGPLGGDQQLGALIAEEKIDAIFFFWDPMRAQPHDVDVKALLRICVLYNIVTACNRSTADFVISSPLFAQQYARRIPDFTAYTSRFDAGATLPTA